MQAEYIYKTVLLLHANFNHFKFQSTPPRGDKHVLHISP